jgi:hypothetical protein
MTDYTVAPLSIEKIEEHARNILVDCPKLSNGAIDILKTLRLPSVKTIHGTKVLRLKLVADDLLPDKLAQVWASVGRVTVTARASLWNKAEDHDPGALKELRHEFGHVVLHSSGRTSSAVTLDRRLEGNAIHKFIEPNRRAEDQADWMASCLAMPLNEIKPSMDVRDVSANWNVPLDEAQWRLERARLVAPKRIPESIRRNIDTFRANAGIPALAQTLWDQLPRAPNRPPDMGRLADGFLVEYQQYNQFTQTGWTVEGQRIVPLMLKMRG